MILITIPGKPIITVTRDVASELMSELARILIQVTPTGNTESDNEN
ncbi:MAG: hypothetical protein ACRD45_20890 [Bryobacteraceae bacterium]